MWQIHFQKLLMFFSNEALIFCLIALMLFCTGCTIKFKGKETDLEILPPAAKIGAVPETNHTFELTAIDIL